MNTKFTKEDFKKEDFKKVLGSGKFGLVYEVEHQGVKYAAKLISKKDIDNNKDPDMRVYMKTALEREINILKKMSEFKNSVGFYLNYETDNEYILILELCDTDLSKLLEKKKKFNSSEIFYIMNSLNKPFKYMHNNDILHRDIKPENIMIKFIDDSKKTYIPKISDYGLSRKLEDGKATTYLGTPRYMAPEILTDD
jgi:serine/threonine protein kinase